MFLSFCRRLARCASAAGRGRRPARRPRLSFIELLEARDLPSGLYPDYILVEPQGMGGATPVRNLGSPPSGSTATAAPNSAVLESVRPLLMPQGADRLGSGAITHWDFSTPTAQPASAAEWDAVFEQMAQGEGLREAFWEPPA